MATPVLIVRKPDGTLIPIAGIRGRTGAKVVRIEYHGRDMEEGMIHKMVFDDGNFAYFTAPAGTVHHVFHGDTMPAMPTQNELSVAVRKMWLKLGGTLSALALMCLPCQAELTRETLWGDVPPTTTKLGTVLDLGTGGGGGGSTNSVPWVKDVDGNMTAVTIGTRDTGDVGVSSFANGEKVVASGSFSHAEGDMTVASGDYSKAGGQYSSAEKDYSHADGIKSVSSNVYAFAWNGDQYVYYGSHGAGTYSVNPREGLKGFYIGSTNMADYLSSFLPVVKDSDGNKTAVTIGSRLSGSPVGKYSFANGRLLVAKGEYTHAEGQESVAQDYYTHAEGMSTTAKYVGTHAEGGNTVADGECTHAEGAFTYSSGMASHAEGVHSKTYETGTHASGYGAVATNLTSFAWQGVATIVDVTDPPASYYYDHGAGTFNISPVGGLGGFYIGSTSLANTLGGYVPWVTDSDGNRTAVTFGSRQSGTVGIGSFVHGVNCLASGDNSHAEGNSSKATGISSHADGFQSKASGNSSYASGYYTEAKSAYSRAEGSNASAEHVRSFVWGGKDTGTYTSKGVGTYGIDPVGGASGFYIGETNLSTHLSLAVTEAKDYTDDQISDYNITTVKPIHTSVTNLQAYLGGQNVRVSVTNYYAASSGNLPRLRIEENVSNNWMIVWDENDKFEHFKTNICEAVSDMTNATIVIVTNELAIGLATKAPLAWGDVTSSGYDAPTSNTVWMSGRTVFSGDTEFKTVQVGSGVVGFCVSKGVQAYTGGDPGQFKFTTDDGRFYFGMNIMDAYVLGCDCSNIVITAVGGNQIVTLRYDVTMTGKPCIYYTPSLEPGFTWEKLSDSMGNPVPGASHVVSWEAAPPAGHEILYCNCGTDPKGFFKAVIEVAADNTFFTNLEADLRGGIRCTNEFLNIRNIIEPYIDDVSLTVKWRVKP